MRTSPGSRVTPGAAMPAGTIAAEPVDCLGDYTYDSAMANVDNESAPAAEGRKCPDCRSSMEYVGKLPSIGLWPRQLVYRCTTCNQIIRDPPSSRD